MDVEPSTEANDSPRSSYQQGHQHSNTQQSKDNKPPHNAPTGPKNCLWQEKQKFMPRETKTNASGAKGTSRYIDRRQPVDPNVPYAQAKQQAAPKNDSASGQSMDWTPQHATQNPPADLGVTPQQHEQNHKPKGARKGGRKRGRKGDQNSTPPNNGSDGRGPMSATRYSTPSQPVAKSSYAHDGDRLRNAMIREAQNKKKLKRA